MERWVRRFSSSIYHHQSREGLAHTWRTFRRPSPAASGRRSNGSSDAFFAADHVVAPRVGTGFVIAWGGGVSDFSLLFSRYFLVKLRGPGSVPAQSTANGRSNVSFSCGCFLIESYYYNLVTKLKQKKVLLIFSSGTNYVDMCFHHSTHKNLKIHILQFFFTKKHNPWEILFIYRDNLERNLYIIEFASWFSSFPFLMFCQYFLSQTHND